METQTQHTEHIAAIKVKELKVANYVLTFGNNGGKSKDKPTLRLSKIPTLGKNKGIPKLIWGYYYMSDLERDNKAKQTYENIKTNVDKDQKAKEDKKAAKEAINLSELVGKIFYESWGYDQTNVDFYQVTGHTDKMLKVRSIASQTIEGSEGFMSSRVKPIVNEFEGEERIMKVNIGYDNKVWIVVNKRHSASIYTNGDKGTYCSWYA
jgi:hypothetical protein